MSKFSKFIIPCSIFKLHIVGAGFTPARSNDSFEFLGGNKSRPYVET
jgi:hypothetical protein